MAGLPTLNGREPQASTPSGMWGQAPGSSNPFKQVGGTINPFALNAAGKGVGGNGGTTSGNKFGPRPPVPPGYGNGGGTWQPGGGNTPPPTGGVPQPPTRPGDWRGQGPGSVSQAFNNQGTGAPKLDQYGYPTITEQGNGWVKYSDGGMFNYNSLAGQKALSMNFGTVNYGRGVSSDLNQFWGRLPLSWRADMAQNWDQTAIKDYLEGLAQPEGMFQMDGQRMTGKQMTAYIDQKMKQIQQQNAQNAASQKRTPTPEAGRVMPGIGG